MSLRQNIAHTSPVDIEVARPFDEAYFCTDDPPTAPNCTVLTTELANNTMNVRLNFYLRPAAPPPPTTACTWARPRHSGVSHWLVTGSTGDPEVAWEYWNGLSWASLDTGAFEGYNFPWPGFAYWADDPPSWTPRAVSSATSLYYARVCPYVFRTGTATVAGGDTQVTFTSPLSSRVSGNWHYSLIFDDAQPETISIVPVDSPTQVTLDSGTAFAHTNAPFRIERAFTTMPTERLITRADVQCRVPVQPRQVQDGPLQQPVGLGGGDRGAERWRHRVRGQVHLGHGSAHPVRQLRPECRLRHAAPGRLPRRPRPGLVRSHRTLHPRPRPSGPARGSELRLLRECRRGRPGTSAPTSGPRRRPFA